MGNKCKTCISKEKDFVTLIIKVVDYCNFECNFCRYYLDEKRQVSSMRFDTFKQILTEACEYNISHGLRHLTVIFHGGEPLLWGLENFKKAICFEREFRKEHEDFRFINDVQTNGSLVDDEWAEFFKLNDFSVGISIDGPEKINFHINSKLPNDVVLNNIKCLSRYGCKYGILTVITEKHDGYADEYYDFLVRNEIHSVGLCYCFDPNEKDIVSNKVLTGFLTNFFDRYFYGNYKLHVREFEFVMKMCLGLKIEGCTFDYRQSCGNYFSVYPNGDIHFCDSYSLDDEPLGNILENDFYEIKSSFKYKNILERTTNSSEICNVCEINDICGGGCARHVISNGNNAFCQTFKVLYPYIKKVIVESEISV